MIAEGGDTDDVGAAFLLKEIGMIATVLGCVAVMAVVAWLIGRGITRPLGQLRAAMARIATGELDTITDRALKALGS